MSAEAEPKRCEDCGHPILRGTSYPRRWRCDCDLLLCSWCRQVHRAMNEDRVGCRDPQGTYLELTVAEVLAAQARQAPIVARARAEVRTRKKPQESSSV